MFARNKPDVLVVGAGPVGLFTALTLTKRGIPVRILDKDWRTGTRSYALALHAESLRYFEELGLLASVLEHARRIRTIAMYDGAQRKAELRISGLSEDHSFLAVLPQESLERILEEALARQKVKVSWSHEAARLEPREKGVDVTIEKLSKDSVGYTVQHTEWVVSGSEHLTVPFVIGADGHFSNVRRAAGIEFPTVGNANEFAVFEFKTDADLRDEMPLVLTGGTTNVCWPLADGACRWSFQKPLEDPDWDTREKDRDFVQVGAGLFPSLNEERLRSLLSERASWFRGNVSGLRWRMMVRFERRLAESFGKGRTWLVGDAGHLTGPAGIQSMNVGFREGRDLANAIAAALQPGGSTEPLEQYGKERLAEWRGLLGVEPMLRGDANTDPWVAEHKDQILPCIPASGRDLATLLGQIGLTCRLPAAFRTPTGKAPTP